MDFLKQNITVTEIRLAMRVTQCTARKLHPKRPTHGFVLHFGGEVRYAFKSGQTFTAHEGDFVYLPKGASYSVSYDETDTDKNHGCYAVNFLCAFSESTEPASASEPFLLRVRKPEPAYSLYRAMITHLNQASSGARELALSDFYKLLALLKTENAPSGYAYPALQKLRPALNLIEKNYARASLTAPALAEEAHMSEAYLRRLFHEAFDMSPIEYVRTLRLMRAKALLDSSESSVAEISCAAGFRDISYFSREFKKKYGLSPRNYVKEAGHEF